MYVRGEWFGIVNGQILSILTGLSACHTSVFWFAESVFTKLGMCIDIYLSIDTASPSSLSIMRRDVCVRIKSKKFIVRAKRVIVRNEKR